MVSGVNGIPQHQIDVTPTKEKDYTSNDAQNTFANTLQQAIESVNEAESISDKKTEALAQGEIDNLHDVMITAQKSSITLETTVQVQRKVIDAYNEVMRMQV